MNRQSEARLARNEQDLATMKLAAEMAGVQVDCRDHLWASSQLDSAAYYARCSQDDEQIREIYRGAALDAQRLGGAVLSMIGTEQQLRGMRRRYQELSEMAALALQ